MFIASPPVAATDRRDLHLVRAVRRDFPGSAEFLRDPGNRAQVAGYVADLAAGGGRAESTDGPGHSYGEMAEALIGAAVGPHEPVDLLILAFAVHDARPGRQTAAYLSHVTPGEPLAFAVCDQGSAAAFSALRIALGYAASTGVRRALLIVVEQASLPYTCPVPLPERHQGVAMLFESDATAPARVVGVRQHPGIAPDEVAARAAADLADLAAGRPDVTLVLGARLAEAWTGPADGRVRVATPGQPSTGVWWSLVDEVNGRPGLRVVADYDADLRYLSLTALES